VAEEEEARREAEDAGDSAAEVALAAMEVDMEVLEEDLVAGSEVEAVDMLLTKSAIQQLGTRRLIIG
jgi:hypothetical protein